MHIDIRSSSTNRNNVRMLPTMLYPYYVEEIIVLIVQPQKILLEDNFLIYMIFLWPVITLPCAVCLYFIRKHSAFVTSYLDAFGVIIGGGSFQIRNRAEKCFVVFLSISSLLLNIQFTGDLFEKYTNIQQEHRLKSINEVVELHLPLHIYGLMWGGPDINYLFYSFG